MTQLIPIFASAGYSPGPMEIAIFAAIVLIFFGPKRLPQLSRAIGKSITDFKRGLHDVQRDIEDSGDDDDDDELEEKSSHRRIASRNADNDNGTSTVRSDKQKVQATASSDGGDANLRADD